ncbi:469_t:CDS:2, partial [Racocetra fulgida]
APAIPNMMALENANAGDFDDAVKVEIIKGKMAGKYAPVPLQNNFVNPAVNIDSPDTLKAWLDEKYQRENIGTKNSAIQKLSQERFQPYDTPDTYEARIRPLILDIANNDAYVLGTLKTHLSRDRELYTHPKKKVPAKQNESIISQSVFPSYDEMQKSFQAMFDKRDAEQKADIAKRDASHKAEIEKLKTEFESKISQQSKKSHPPVLPKDYEQIHEFYADQGDPRWSNLSKEEALQ